MGRIRTIKPEFPQSESMGRVSREARLLFIMLWTIADDYGRARASSRMLASLLYPYDEDAPELMDVWLQELISEDCVRIYEANGSHYLDIPKWKGHQRVDRPTPSKLPEFRERSPQARDNSRELVEASLTDLDLDLDLGRDLSCRKRNPEPQTATARKRGQYAGDFEEFWKIYPTDPGMSKQEAAKAWEKLTPDDRQAAVDGVPGFREWIRKQKADYRTLHACRYLSQRRFDGFANNPINGNGKSSQVDWTTFTRRDYENAVDIAKSRDEWFPAYGPSDRIPPDLMDDDLRRIVGRAKH